jgi:transcriptional regulator with XRE-family HTH domain
MAKAQARSIEVAFGMTLRLRREKRGLSQEELADKAGLHRTYVSQIERGLKSPTLSSMYRLAKALEVSLSKLIEAAE